MSVPSQEIEGCRAAHVRLSATVNELSADAVTAPSRLPGWSVAHVLTHLARNADSVVRRLEGVKQGRSVEQYAGGRAGRSQEIAAGVARTPEAIKRDVVGPTRQLIRRSRTALLISGTHQSSSAAARSGRHRI